MGTASQKVITLSSGNFVELASVKTSAGAGDVDKLVALNASGILDSSIVNSKATSSGVGDAGKLAALNGSGVLDSTIVNSKTTSSGASDSGKIPALNASGILDSTIVNSKTSSAGAGDSNKIPALDGSGKLDLSFMPSGIGPDTASITASENLAAGDYVNIWNSSGAKVRKADGASAGKEAHGFVLSAVSSSAAATVYFEGTNTQVTGQTPGVVYLSDATPGLGMSTPPSTSAHICQKVGFSTGATAVNFQFNPPITLA